MRSWTQSVGLDMRLESRDHTPAAMVRGAGLCPGHLHDVGPDSARLPPLRHIVLTLPGEEATAEIVASKVRTCPGSGRAIRHRQRAGRGLMTGPPGDQAVPRGHVVGEPG